MESDTQADLGLVRRAINHLRKMQMPRPGHHDNYNIAFEAALHAARATGSLEVLREDLERRVVREAS